VYNLDLRNHGDSPHSAVHDYTSMAVDVEQFISSQRLEKPTLIGHSMGAKVAMTLALRSPSQYSALIPVDNAPVDAALKSDFGKYVSAMREIEDHQPPIQKQSDADKILAKHESDISIRQFLLTNFVKMSPKDAPPHKAGDHRHAHKTELRFRIPLRTLAKSLPAMADFPFKDPDVARFEGPTLVVRGTKSHYVSDESLPLIGKFFPRFELLDCDCGHWVMAEKFEDFRAGVVEWIERVVDEN
jgi:pimeloyl-ACP methyl ester carboxylesterase